MRLDYITSYGRAFTRKKVTIVGRKHSSVTLTCNERVYFRREKDNPHDINALLVLNMAGSKVGHVIASTAPDARGYSECVVRGKSRIREHFALSKL